MVRERSLGLNSDVIEPKAESGRCSRELELYTQENERRVSQVTLSFAGLNF
jgi:hypothetical protein